MTEFEHQLSTSISELKVKHEEATRYQNKTLSEILRQARETNGRVGVLQIWRVKVDLFLGLDGTPKSPPSKGENRLEDVKVKVGLGLIGLISLISAYVSTLGGK